LASLGSNWDRTRRNFALSEWHYPEPAGREKALKALKNLSGESVSTF
jgi:hypothetical protein